MPTDVGRHSEREGLFRESVGLVPAAEGSRGGRSCWVGHAGDAEGLHGDGVGVVGEFPARFVLGGDGGGGGGGWEELARAPSFQSSRRRSSTPPRRRWKRKCSRAPFPFLCLSRGDVLLLRVLSEGIELLPLALPLALSLIDFESMLVADAPSAVGRCRTKRRRTKLSLLSYLRIASAALIPFLHCLES